MLLRSALFLVIFVTAAFAQTNPPGVPEEEEGPPAQTAQPPSAAPQQPSTTPASPAQQQPPTPSAPAQQAPQAPKAKAVPPTAPVITLNGFCEAPATAPAKPTAPQNCRKVITKAEFEKVMEAVIPKSRRPDADANPQVKQAIARQYADILVMANEAKKRGIQHNPNTQELLRLSQLQVLAQGLLQDLNEKAKPSETEITKYYNDNKASFEEGIVRRLFIPKQTAPAPAQPAAGSEAKPAPPATNAPVPDAAAQKAFAEKIRERGAAGEDFDKLQKEAFESAKNTQTPPSTQLGPRRRGSLPPDHDAAVFALKPGEVSQLFDTASGWYLYKLESKRQVPLSDVREELTRRLQPQKFTDARTAIANSVKPDFNPDYFGATTTSPVTAASPRGAAQTPKGPRLPRGAAPPAPAQPAPQPQPTQPK